MFYNPKDKGRYMMLEKIILENRAMGKTTRMIEAAMESARSGRKTFIIAKDETHARQLKYMINYLKKGVLDDPFFFL
jgi:hypothetical protein